MLSLLKKITPPQLSPLLRKVWRLKYRADIFIKKIKGEIVTQAQLKTQLKQHGKLRAWCAQYNAKTLQPEMARKFELASLSGSESVGIVLQGTSV